MADEKTTAELIRDDLIAQDVRYRRADAAVRRKVDARLSSLSRELRTIILDVDVAGTQRKDARARRLKRLRQETGVAIRTAYSEINGILKASLRQVAKIEAMSTVKIVAKNLP